MVDEPFVVRIPHSLYQEMVVHVVEAYPDEACGIVESKDGQIVRHYPTVNVAEQPDDFSIIDPHELLRITLEIDDDDGVSLYYHSHPKSEAYPSPRDKEWARHNGYTYIIFSHRFYPEPPYARVFRIGHDDSVTEGTLEVA
jgi:proteasome lid subunit RPN8/RPN11